ncbi:MAG: CmcJ/NvfI family oxidoreductase [Gammaproteobacteria bacterium]
MNDTTASIAYLADGVADAAFRIYPPSSGRGVDSPPLAEHAVSIADCRGLVRPPALDAEGFALIDGVPVGGLDFRDAHAVRRRFYPAIESLLRATLGAEAVFAFDHNVRSVAGAAQGARGVNAPVPQAHGDYTPASAARRMHEVLAARAATALAVRPYALVNAWCPLRGPVLDVPLAVCDARSVAPTDLVTTSIDHFAEGDLARPSHTGHIYSLRHNPAHRWYYAAAMQAGEALLLKCFDARPANAARCAPHAAFRHPQCPQQHVPRESVEVRTLIVYAPGAAAAHAH